MKNNVYTGLLLLSLFGIALGFFGNLYEGLILIPKMPDPSVERMHFWKAFYATISPAAYYIPLVPVATVLLGILYLSSSTKNRQLKKQLGLGLIFQVLSLLISFYIVNRINLKFSFGNFEKYAAEIPAKTQLVAILSPLRIVVTGIALIAVFRAYVKTQKEEAGDHDV